MAQHYKKLCPSCLYISGTIHHMIFFYVTHVLKDNIPCVFVHFFQILIFGVNSWVKGQKMAQNDEKLSVALHTSGSIHHMIVIFGSHVLNNDISRCFFHFFSMIFQIVREVTGQEMPPSPPPPIFFGGVGGKGGGIKREKMTHKYQCQSFTLYISKTVTVGHIKIFGTRV